MSNTERETIPETFTSPEYLLEGSPRQRRAYRALQDLRIFIELAAYTPVLTGTIPIGIDRPGSDLDIICCTPDLIEFAGRSGDLYGERLGFRLRRKAVAGEDSVVANFEAGGFPVEVFAQTRPVEQQRAYRHMLVEARLLALGGAEAVEGIRRLRAGGLKTEPAFAAYFSLPGDPYEALLNLYDLDDRELAGRVGL